MFSRDPLQPLDALNSFLKIKLLQVYSVVDKTMGEMGRLVRNEDRTV